MPKKRAPWTLRRRITLTVAGLLALSTLLIGIVSVLALRSFLVDRLDAQLTAAAGRSQSAVREGHADREGHEKREHSEDRDNAIGALLAPGQSAGTLVAIVGADGVTAGILNARGEVTEAAPATREIAEATTSDEPVTLHVPRFGEFRAISTTSASGVQLVIGLPMTEVEAATRQLLIVIVIVAGIGIAATIIIGRLIIRHELKPLDRVAETAQRVSELPLESGEVDLNERVDDVDTDTRTEVGRVGAAVNAMLGHVDNALQVRHASEEKVRRFVSDASHELRTPLASIRGYAELTRRSGEKMPEQVAHSLDRIESEATRMTAIVEDLLLLARLDEGRELRYENVDLTMMVINAVSDAHAAGPDHVWDMTLPKEPIEIMGDPARLHQVIANLLSNARTHTPAGTAVITSLSRTDDGVRISVLDKGPGIPKKDLPTLFERFTRGDESRARTSGTTGLGLAIAHAVVKAHGGTLTVSSKKGRTEFVVVLPAQPVQDAPPEHGEEPKG